MIDQTKEIHQLVRNAERIVVTSHRSPDGDSIGSSVGMYFYLKKIGKEVKICHPDAAPKFISWVVPENSIDVFDENPAQVEELFNHADLIFSLDYNDPTRMGKEMGELLVNSNAKKVMIDHHLHPKEFVDAQISRPEVSSTSQLVFHWISQEFENVLDAEICTPLYMGMMTDTGSFRFSSVTAETHDVLAQMLRLGVKQEQIHEAVYDNVPLHRLKLRSFLLSEKLEFVREYGIAITTVSLDELNQFNYEKGDTEGVVNSALAIEGVKASIFLSEKEEGVVKLSFRSRPEVAVNTFAMDIFEGGGHRNAAGGIFFGTLEEAVNTLKTNLKNYFA